MPFPRDHWYHRKVLIIWDEFECEGDPATPVSRAGEPEDSRSPPLSDSVVSLQEKAWVHR
jgi:hypothetical protein